MLTHIKLTNYKAFSEARLEFKPLTIILGKNNVGKSSLLGFLDILKQTSLQLDSNYPSALRINGKYANAGNPKNLFHHGNTLVPIDVEIGFTIKNFTDVVDDLIIGYQRNIATYASMMTALSAKPGRTRAQASSAEELIYAKTPSLEATKNLLASLAGLKLDDTELLKKAERLLGAQIGRRPNRQHPYKLFFSETYEDASTTQAILESLKALSTKSHAAIRFSLILKESNLEFSKLAFVIDETAVLDLIISNGAISNFESDVISSSQTKTSPDLLDGLFASDRTLFNCIDPSRGEPINQPRRIFGEVCSFLISSLGDHFKDNTFSHIPPLRTKPKRYYFSDELVDNYSVPSVVLDSLITRSNILKSVNKWFSKFGIQLSAKNEQDIYYRILLAQDNKDIDLDITDLGFGISQVLPIITYGFIVPPNSTLMIEQPEVHLHPKMQASLADLFEEITRSATSPKRDKLLIIETHSEYILTRLAYLHSQFRRNSGDTSIPSIDPADVIVHFVEAPEDLTSSTVRTVEPPKSGTYVLPDDFIDEELEMYMATLTA